MNNKNEKRVEKLSNEEVSGVSGGKSLKQRPITYPGRRPQYKHPITLKYGVPCPREPEIKEEENLKIADVNMENE